MIITFPTSTSKQRSLSRGTATHPLRVLAELGLAPTGLGIVSALGSEAGALCRVRWRRSTRGHDAAESLESQDSGELRGVGAKVTRISGSNTHTFFFFFK